MELLFNKICNFIGLRLLTLGAQLSGYSIVTLYNPGGDQYVRAVHLAENETHLNNSMRTYVEALDASYEL